jgi:hypothetical protein
LDEPRRVGAHFDVVDDLLWQAVAGRLPELGSIALGRSGRIGPLVELAMAAVAVPDAYQAVSVEPPVFQQVMRAFLDGAISGAAARDRAGAFPLSRLKGEGGGADEVAWEQWAMHAENAALAAGLAKGLVAGLMGALGELQDNVFEHSIAVLQLGQGDDHVDEQFARRAIVRWRISAGIWKSER